MATKKEWQDYLKVIEKYAKELKAWIKKLKDGEVTTADGPGGNPPTPPPPPPL